MKSFLFSLMLVCCGLAHGQNALQSALAGRATSSVVTTPHVRAELMAYAPDGVQIGKPLMLGLQIQHQPEWHTYWKNPGDSGLPIQLAWQLPAGIDAGEIAWPTPKKIPVANLANFGYEGMVLLPVPMNVASTFQTAANEVSFSLKAQWLVCKTECIPEEGEFTLKVPVQGSTALAKPLFDAAQSAAPKAHSGKASFAPEPKALKLVIDGLPAAWQGKNLEAFPEDGDIIESAAKPSQSWAGGQWTATIPLSSQRANSPSKMVWLIKTTDTKNASAVRAEALLDGAWPPSTATRPTSISPELSAALQENKNIAANSAAANWSSATYWLAILGALLGGLILNLMPCVLPVLAIKLLGFTSNATTKSTLRGSSGLFALGVIGSFALLGAALLALRGAGQSLGWGFQLQSPAVVLALAALFTLIGLNLFGLFNVGFLWPSRLANYQSNNPKVESLASGALAVLIATPCTAPFMGASLGLAITLPAMQALLIFVALGFGMALPFVLIALFPAIGAWLVRALPKPGAWMEKLRRWLAWPMFATAAWLIWVFALQVSSSSGAPSSAQSASVQAESAWQVWSAQKQNDARAAGRPVFVDFTAAWCITCQVNKSTTLGSAEVEAAFKAKNVLLLRADWTSPNPAIAAELAKLGRSGLPVYAFYLPGSTTPQLLPEVLTKAIVLQALSVL